MREWQSQTHVRWYCRYHVVIVPISEVAGSHGPKGAFMGHRPPMGGYLKPPARRVVGDFP